jgi:glycine oxidase
VTLTDAGALGGQASWAGAGLLALGGEFHHESRWTRLAIESMGLYPGFVSELTGETGVPIDFRIQGAVESAESPADWDELVSRAYVQQSLGITCEIRVDSILYPHDGLVDPRAVTQALRVACLARGIDLREHCSVTEVDSGKYAAVVVAGGAWSSGIRVLASGHPLTLPLAHPVKGHLIGYNLQPGSLPLILRRGHTYILQRTNGFTIAGSTTEDVGFNATVDPRICADIHERASRLWPELTSSVASERWVGFRPATATGEPAFGRIPGSNVWLAYGHYRNGILFAPVSARDVAAGITSNSETDSSSRASSRG